MRNYVKMSDKVATKDMFLSYRMGSVRLHCREGPLKQNSHVFLSLVHSLEYYFQFGSPIPVAMGSYHFVPFMSKCDQREERKRAGVAVVMLRIDQLL